MSNTVQTADAADEAGGEAIYSSDGLPPLSIPPPPIVQNPAENKNNDNENILDSGDGLDLTCAFEVFGGKVFKPSPSSSMNKNYHYRGASVVESPLERLARLHAEVAELEADLAKPTATTTTAATDGVEDQTDLLRLARELSIKLTSIGSSNNNNNNDKNKEGGSDDDNNGSSLTEAFRGRQEELTEIIRAQLIQMNTTQTQPKTTIKDNNNIGEGGIIYELYGSASASATNASEGTVETRLSRMERAIGSVVGESSSEKTVLERLFEAEKLLAAVDDKKVEASAARAKVIRADLEAAAKARSKLASAASLGSTSSSSPDDTKKITTLYDQLLNLEGISSHLPILISRLEQLSSLHVQASDFTTRLLSVEDMIKDTERLLINMDEVLNKVDDGFVSNVEIIEKNMNLLDERIKSLDI